MAAINDAFTSLIEERNKILTPGNYKSESKETYYFRNPNDKCNGCLEEKGVDFRVKTRIYTCYKHFEEIFGFKPNLAELIREEPVKEEGFQPSEQIFTYTEHEDITEYGNK
jgi:hypothetical protein